MPRIILLLLFTYSFTLFGQGNEFVLSSGSEGGNYAKTGDLIIKLFNEQFPNSFFTNVKTTGSIENLQNLEHDFSDFAIVQRNLLLKTIYSESKGVKNVEIIAPLFQEKLLIYHKKIKDNNSIRALKEKIKAKTYKSIGFTSKDGYAYLLFQKICQLLNISLDDLTLEFANYETLIKKFNKNELDLLISFSMEIEELEKNPQTTTYTFSEKEVSLITTRISNTNQIKINENEYTIGSYTFFIGTSSEIEAIETKYGIGLSKTIFDGFKKDNSFIGTKINDMLASFKLKERHSYLEGLPVSESLANQINYDTNSFYKSYYFLIFIVIVLLLFLFFRKVIDKKLRFRFYWLRYNHIFFGLFLLVILYVTSIEILIWAEQNLYEQLKLKSQILNMSRSDLHLWVFVSSMVSDSNGIFPLSTVGKLMLSISFYTTWIGGICIVVAEYFKKQSFKKRRKGMKQINFTDHIVISGWNTYTHRFVFEFLNAVNNHTNKSEKLVCIVPNPEEIVNGNEELDTLQKSRKIEFIAGDIKEEDVLRQANIHKAKTVVLFAENNEVSADEKTLLRALSISRFCRKESFKKRAIVHKAMNYDQYEVNRFIDSIYIIAELNNENFKQDLLASDVNEIICSSNYGRNVITQTILNRGVSKILDEVLTYNNRNEFYNLSLCDKDNKILVGKTFDELLVLLRKVQIQLIGIKIIYYDNFNKEIIDREAIAVLLAEDGFESDIIINPVIQVEMDRKVDDDDTLIVFCKSGKELTKRIKLLNTL